MFRGRSFLFRFTLLAAITATVALLALTSFTTERTGNIQRPAMAPCGHQDGIKTASPFGCYNAAIFASLDEASISVVLLIDP